MVSIIIPYHNEGVDFVQETLLSINKTVKIQHEIIIVDDFSDIPLIPITGVKVVRHLVNKGVGRAFDTGVTFANYDNIILIGCDVRFEKNNWAENLVEEINKYPKSLICTTCVNYKSGIAFKDSAKYYGANLLETFNKTVLEAQWITKPKDENSYEIQCILGACYIVKKEWFVYIDGWWGHKQWGTLEPYISLKSRLFGGSCRLAKYIEVGHIFKPKDGNFHKVDYSNLVYNKLLVLKLLFEGSQYNHLYNWIPNTVLKQRAQKTLDGLEGLEIKIAEYGLKIHRTGS